MRGGRRSRSRKTAAKEEPIVRVAPTRRSRAKVRRPSRPVTPRKRAVAPRVETPKPVARRKPAPPKVATPKPVARRKPAPPKPVVRRKPTPPKPVARRKPKPVASKKPTAPKIPESVQKRIEEMIASGRMKAPAPKKPVPKKTVAKKKPVPPKVTRPKPVARRKPAVQPVRNVKLPEITPEVQKRIQEALADLNIGGSRPTTRRAAPKPPPKRKTTPRKTVAKKATPKKTVAKKKPVEPKLPEGVRSGGRTYTNPVSGDKMYQPPMPKVGRGQVQAMVMPTPINLTTGKPERLMISEPTKPKAPDTQQLSSDPKIAKLQKYFLDRGLGIPPRAESSFEEKEDYKEYLIDMKKDVRSNFGDPTNPALGYKPEEAAYLAENQPKYQEFNERLKESQRMAREPNKYADRFFRPTSTVGTPDSLIPSNIVGQSFDPSFAASFTPPPQPPGSVFGGYGQQAPMAALAPYAGMAQSQPMPTDFFPSYVPKPAPIIETVQRPEPNRPTPRPDARPVMVGGSGRMMGGAGIDRGFGRDQINYGEFIPYR